MTETPRLSATASQRLRELVLRRLEADWFRAAAGKGNPYRDDLAGQGRATALGELVAAFGRHPEVEGLPFFGELVRDIDDLSRSLPGTHPLLRRSMRKLAQGLAR